MTEPAGKEGQARQRLMHLRVRLRPHARILRHEYRGQDWYVIEDRLSGRAHRVGPAARAVLDLLDGVRTLEQALEEAQRRLGPEAPTPEELIALVGTLYRADLLSADTRPDLEELSAPEIANVLQVNLNTVYSRLRAARREVSARLAQVPEGAS